MEKPDSRHSPVSMEELYFFPQHELSLEPLDAPGWVLDIGGGGEGIIGRLMGDRVVAVDQSRQELADAPEGPIKVEMDARDLKFLPDAFGLVTSFFSLMFMPGEDHGPVFAEALRVLAPGGRFLIWDLDLPTCLDPSRSLAAVPLRIRLPLEDVETSYITPWPAHAQDLDYYSALAERMGFEILEARQEGQVILLALQKPVPKGAQPLERSPGESVRMSFEPDLIVIEPGPFIMGTSDAQIDWLADRLELANVWREKGFFGPEQPQHIVSLPRYAIARHPVTVGEFRAFVQGGGYKARTCWTDAGWAWRQARQRRQPDYWEDPIWTGRDELPVVGVSWYEASAYCRWLSDVTGRRYRLPSEVEWERAARGVDGRIFPWGDIMDTAYCNARPSGVVRTSPVGNYSPDGNSPEGLVDAAGNVAEWTASLLAPYPYNLADGRDDPDAPGERVTRGGSWRSPLLRVRATARAASDPTYVDQDLGFRCTCRV